MKIIIKCVISMRALQVVEEESYEYSGPITKCKGQSGGGGGGGSGVVTYPAHITSVQHDWLDKTGVDAITTSVTAAMTAAHLASPWLALTAYDPDADITAYEAAIAGFDAMLAGINEPVDWAALYTQAEATIDGVVDAEIVADTAAFAANLDDQITTVILPRFQSGMRDINAVVSSAFVVGEAVIEGFRNRDVAKHSSALRISSVNSRGLQYLEATSQMLRFLMQKYSWEDGYMRTVIESNRIKIVAKKEQAEVDAKLDEADALWDLEVFQHGANVLAAGGGAAVQPQGKQVSATSSMIGGALTGAVAGAMISGGNPIGALIGGVLGAGSSLL